MKKRRTSLQELIDFLGDDLIKIYGDIKGVFFDNLADLEHVNELTLDWINKNKKNKQELADGTVARTIIVDPSIVYSEKMQTENKVLICVENPRKTMAKVIGKFFVEEEFRGVHASAIIDNNAIVDSSASIGPGCVLGRCQIGKNTIIKPNVVIYDDVVIGDHCLIHAGTVIGTDGLGCMREHDGSLIKFPHVGGVIIGNKVEIGANCQIAKGVLSDTIIKNGCKINGLCFIAHNCILEENVWITGDTMLCGTVHVGKNATIFSNVVVRDQRMIGDNAVIGMGSVVTKDVPACETWMGNPAKPVIKE